MKTKIGLKKGGHVTLASRRDSMVIIIGDGADVKVELEDKEVFQLMETIRVYFQSTWGNVA